MPLPAPIQPLLRLLHEMRDIVDRLDDQAYAAPAPGRTSGGVGGHVRHCLDHIAAWLGATQSGVCEYDRRRRGTDVETSRGAAAARIAELTARLAAVDASLLDDPVLVETQLEPGGAMMLTRSSICRELAFVISHTIHHNAIVGQLLSARRIPLSARFGLAPSTPSPASEETPEGTLSCAR